MASDRSHEHRCFHEWMAQQEQDLAELLQALQRIPADRHNREAFLRQLIDKNIRHIQEYSERRIRLAREDVNPYFSPTWCSSLENSLLWLGGCRPTMFIRLVYALCGLQMECHLAQFLQGIGDIINLSQLTPTQLGLINDLQQRTIQEEERMAGWMASLQEKIGDQQLAEIVRECKPGNLSNRKADEALDDHEVAMVSVLETADRLRLKTLKELMNVLSPVQAVNYLAASKKLHLCVHGWGERRDRNHGRKPN